MAVVSAAGRIEIEGSDQYEGGHIVDLSINVDIINGASAQVKLVNEKGDYTEPDLGTKIADSVIIEIFSATNSSVFSTDFLPIESNETDGPGGRLMQVSFIEAGPALVRKIPVQIRGRMTNEEATSGNMSINVGAKYFTSPGQDGALIRASDPVTASQRKKLEDSEFLKSMKVEAPPIYLFTARELMDGIIACSVPYTLNFYNFMYYGMEGMYFSNGGNLGTVLQEITSRAGNQWYWNGYGSDIPSVQLTGMGTHGLDVFVSDADIAELLEELKDDDVIVNDEDEITTITDDSQLLSSSITRSLRGTNSMGASFALHVSPTHPANMDRGQVRCTNLSAASKKQQSVDCKGNDIELTESFYRDDGSRKKPDPIITRKILGYCRLVNALRMGEEFFRVYVYMKLVGTQKQATEAATDDFLPKRNTNTGYESAWAWLKEPDSVKEVELYRNIMIDELFFDCVNVAAPMKTTDDADENWPDKNSDTEKPWSNGPQVSSIMATMAGTSEEKILNLETETMVAYVQHRDGEEADNLLNRSASSKTYTSLLETVSNSLTKTYLIPGTRDVLCGKKTEKPKNYATFTWNVNARFFAPFPVQETNPFAIATSDHIFYQLAHHKSKAADWKTLITDPDFKGFNFATLVAFLRDDYKSIGDAYDDLFCPEQEKDAIQAEKDDDTEWACSTQHTELMPNGKLVWGQHGRMQEFSKDQLKEAEAWVRKFHVSTKMGDVGPIQTANAAGFSCILLPYTNVKPIKKEYTYNYEVDTGKKDKDENVIYKTENVKLIAPKVDEIDNWLEELDGAFTPLDILNNDTGGTRDPLVAWEAPGEARNYLRNALVDGTEDVLNVSNQHHSVQLEDVLKATPGADGWRAGIRKIKCDGKLEDGQFASLISSGKNKKAVAVSAGKLEVGSGLANKGEIIGMNLQDMANSSNTFDGSLSIGGSYTYAGIPDMPSIWEGLQGLSISINAKGITTTINIGKIKVQGSRYQRYQQTSLRDFVVSEGYDSTAQFFGTEFKNRAQQSISSYSIKIDKPNQANLAGPPPIQPPPT